MLSLRCLRQAPHWRPLLTHCHWWPSACSRTDRPCATAVRWPSLCRHPQQRGQLFTSITPLESTPLQLLGSCNESASSTLLEPQQRGWIGAGAGAGVAAVGAWLCASILHKRLAKRFADGAEHWDLQAYKRGGGLSHSPPLPATATCSADSSSLRVLVDGLPSYLLQHHRLRESALR